MKPNPALLFARLPTLAFRRREQALLEALRAQARVLVSARAAKRVQRGRALPQTRDARRAQLAAHGRDAHRVGVRGERSSTGAEALGVARRATERGEDIFVVIFVGIFFRAMPCIDVFRVCVRERRRFQSARAGPADCPARAAREPNRGARARSRLRLGRDRPCCRRAPARAFRLRDRRHDDGLEVRGDALEPARVRRGGRRFVFAWTRARPRAGTRRPEEVLPGGSLETETELRLRAARGDQDEDEERDKGSARAHRDDARRVETPLAVRGREWRPTRRDPPRGVAFERTRGEPRQQKIRASHRRASARRTRGRVYYAW
jgi:hypothetical protein